MILVLGAGCEGREAGQGAVGREEGEVNGRVEAARGAPETGSCGARRAGNEGTRRAAKKGYTCGVISALCLICSLFVF